MAVRGKEEVKREPRALSRDDKWPARRNSGKCLSEPITPTRAAISDHVPTYW